jgi:WD40 repeat protein
MRPVTSGSHTNSIHIASGEDGSIIFWSLAGPASCSLKSITIPISSDVALACDLLGTTLFSLHTDQHLIVSWDMQSKAKICEIVTDFPADAIRVVRTPPLAEPAIQLIVLVCGPDLSSALQTTGFRSLRSRGGVCLRRNQSQA